jgi:hypothetical protein
MKFTKQKQTNRKQKEEFFFLFSKEKKLQTVKTKKKKKKRKAGTLKDEQLYGISGSVELYSIRAFIYTSIIYVYYSSCPELLFTHPWRHLFLFFDDG